MIFCIGRFSKKFELKKSVVFIFIRYLIKLPTGAYWDIRLGGANKIWGGGGGELTKKFLPPPLGYEKAQSFKNKYFFPIFPSSSSFILLFVPSFFQFGGEGGKTPLGI